MKNVYQARMQRLRTGDAKKNRQRSEDEPVFVDNLCQLVVCFHCDPAWRDLMSLTNDDTLKLEYSATADAG